MSQWMRSMKRLRNNNSTSGTHSGPALLLRKGYTMKEIRIKLSALLVASTILLLILVGLVFKFSGTQLTQTEDYLLTIIITLLSIFISWYVSKRSVRNEVMEGFKGETGKAYRRSKIAVQKIGAVIDVVISRLGVYKQGIEKTDKEAILEVFRNISGQLEGLKYDLEAAIQDWDDIIPDTVKKDKESIREIEKIKEQVRNDQLIVLKQIEQIQKSKSLDDKNKQSQIDLLQVQLSTLESRMLSEVRQVDPFVPTGITASGFGSASAYIHPSNSAMLSSMGVISTQNSSPFTYGVLDASLANSIRVDDLASLKSQHDEGLSRVILQNPSTPTASILSEVTKDKKSIKPKE